MFTGLVTDVGRVRAIESRGDTRVTIETAYDMTQVAIGASIACNGVCLTVVDKGLDADGQNWFAVDCSAETLRCSALGAWRAGSRVNLERSLRVGDEIGGHIVTGHVDAVGTIESIAPEGASLRFVFSAPRALAGYIAAKGSIAVNGVSLTVNGVEDQTSDVTFTVNIIPHTQERTAFCAAAPGDAVNLEVDILARYVARLKDVHP